MKNIIMEIFTRIFPLFSSERRTMCSATTGHYWTNGLNFRCTALRGNRRWFQTGSFALCFAAVHAIHHLCYSETQLYSRRRKKPGVFFGIASLMSFSFCTVTCCTCCRRKHKLCAHAAASAYAFEREGFRSKSAALLT